MNSPDPNSSALGDTNPPKRWFNRTVAGAGLTSVLGDFCDETTTVILPGVLAVLGVWTCTGFVPVF
ncbi:MAG: hypothetical protein ACK4L4_02035 [Gemmobacter sp.]